MVVATVSQLVAHSTPANRAPTVAPSLSSRNSSEHFFILGDDRKLSICEDYQRTQKCLSNLFVSEELSAEELIYNLFKIPHKNDASIGKLLMVLKNYGLLETDPRLQPMMAKIREFEQQKEDTRGEARDPRHWKLKREHFKSCIFESLSLISKTLQNDLIVPSWGEFTRIIKEIYLKCKSEECDGKVADYIPQLNRMSPDLWGVALCTVDGQRQSLGDAKIPFCVQSVSKAFNYAIAASELGAEYVHRHVGQEPSGRLFNEICLDSNHKPHNPMVNSGAIIVTSLIQKNLNMADRFDHMLTQYRKISGGEYVGFNNAVFLSERSTADRNFALAYYMKENGCFPPETNSLTEALDFYFQLCSLEVTCESAAVMAATLANGGVCPITGERCIGSSQCRDVLSLMNSCGMYDYSGQFAFHVGLPAKSGVSGIMIVVVPNLLGLALWSPPLDKLGNSARGVQFCKEMIQRFNFHNYDSLVHNESHKFDPRRRVGEREKDQIVSLLFAAKAGDINTIRRMYMQGYDLELADYDKRTALHLAASEGNVEVAQFLLYIARVRPDPRDRLVTFSIIPWNRTPLHDAKGQGHLGCVQLLEKVLSITEHDDDEEDPFSKEDADSGYFAPSGRQPIFHLGDTPFVPQPTVQSQPQPQQSLAQQRPYSENINAKNMGSLVKKIASEETLFRQRANSLEGLNSGRVLLPHGSTNGPSEGQLQRKFSERYDSNNDASISPPINRRVTPMTSIHNDNNNRHPYHRQHSSATDRADSVERYSRSFYDSKSLGNANYSVSPKLSDSSNALNDTKNGGYVSRKSSPDYHVNTKDYQQNFNRDYSNLSGDFHDGSAPVHANYLQNPDGKRRNSEDRSRDLEKLWNESGTPKRKSSRAKRDKRSRRTSEQEHGNDYSGKKRGSACQCHVAMGSPRSDYSSAYEPTEFMMAHSDHPDKKHRDRNQEIDRSLDHWEQDRVHQKRTRDRDRYQKSDQDRDRVSKKDSDQRDRGLTDSITQIDDEPSDGWNVRRSSSVRCFSKDIDFSILNMVPRNGLIQKASLNDFRDGAKVSDPSAWSVVLRSADEGKVLVETANASPLKGNPLKMVLGKIPALPKQFRSYPQLKSTIGGSSPSLCSTETRAANSAIIETIKRNMRMHIGHVSSSSSDSSDSEPSQTERPAVNQPSQTRQ